MRNRRRVVEHAGVLDHDLVRRRSATSMLSYRQRHCYDLQPVRPHRAESIISCHVPTHPSAACRMFASSRRGRSEADDLSASARIAGRGRGWGASKGSEVGPRVMGSTRLLCNRLKRVADDPRARRRVYPGPRPAPTSRCTPRRTLVLIFLRTVRLYRAQ